MAIRRVENKDISLAYLESQDMYRKLVESSKAGVYMCDAKGDLFYVNHSFVEILGYNHKNEVLGINIADKLYVDPQERRTFLDKMDEKGFVKDYIVKNKRKDGSTVILSVTSNYILNNHDEVIGVEGIIQDITQRQELERSLLLEKKKLEQLLAFDEKVCAIYDFEDLVEFIVEKTSKILEVEKCSLMLLEEETNELTIKAAKGLDKKVIESTRVKVGQQMAGVVVQEKKPMLIENIEYDKEYHRANRSSYLSRSFMIVPIKIGPNVVGVINVSDKHVKLDYQECFDTLDLKILCAIAREVSVALSNMKMYNDLSIMALIDPLTHLYNFRKFTKTLEYEISRSHRVGNHLCIMMIDVDDFKEYNDRFGHLEGDILLKKLGKIFKNCLRITDVVCRYGGDEFAVILPDTDHRGTQIAAFKINEELKKETFKKNVTLSIGMAKYYVGLSQKDLVKKADDALYKAKFEGKNRSFMYEI